MSCIYFGNNIIPKSQVFYSTKLSFAFVNLKPIKRGHVLVSPFRKVDRVSKLNHNEISDLWITAQKVGNVIESVYKGTSLSYVIQDGPEAGQSVNHVHIHIIPREKLDFVENDQIYDELNKVDNDSRKPRTVEEMANEAITLRNYFE